MNLGGTVRISRCGMLTLFGLCVLIIVYYVATNHQVKGSLANTLKSQLRFNKKPQDKFVDMGRLLAVAIEVAERGGSVVKQVRRDSDLNLKSKGKTREGVINPVTDGDMRSHYEMYFGLKKMFPQLTVISEEHMHPNAAHPDILPISGRNAEVERLTITELDDPVQMDDITVWIDPLDATKEYSENKLQYVTTMVCVAVRGEPVMGVIHQPFKQDSGVTYWAWAERGHSQTLQLGKQPEFTSSQLPDPLKVLVSMSHTGGKTEVFAKKAFGESTKIVPAAGAGYKALATLWGEGDVYLHTTLIKKWDTCAPNAILRAMGGKMTTLSGQTINYAAREEDKKEKIEDGLLGAAFFHNLLLEKVKKAQQT
ncbi:inositol monophosphatase 3-like [Amphibalanus amphitrite]|uniref:inositol monophosphatase 3-like n=1 Tax=Amphibalanus amphitrite TaxID=1232801 RepID=UPI001C926A39|nr:inositol monophosphatase 3-like [Amphibalanus amphitrite]